MGVFDYIRLIAGSAFLAFGLVIFFTEVFGAFRFRYVLNRMHVAAMGDTLGIASSLVGLIIFSGINFTSLKLLLIIVFLWLASPVSSHVLARLEVATNENLESYCEVYTDIESLEAELVTEAKARKTETETGEAETESESVAEIESGNATAKIEPGNAVAAAEPANAAAEIGFKETATDAEFGEAATDSEKKGGAS